MPIRRSGRDCCCSIARPICSRKESMSRSGSRICRTRRWWRCASETCGAWSVRRRPIWRATAAIRDPGDLAAHRIISLAETRQTENWSFAAGASRAGGRIVRLAPRLVVNNIAAAKASAMRRKRRHPAVLLPGRGRGARRPPRDRAGKVRAGGAAGSSDRAAGKARGAEDPGLRRLRAAAAQKRLSRQDRSAP